MTVKIQNNREKEKVWNAEFNIFGTGDMCFTYRGNALLKSEGIELGMLKETHGIEKICRSHSSSKTGWSWVETETFHPFGSEPVVKRKWEQAANHIKVVSDIIIRATMPVDHISIDSLKLFGQWSKVLIFSQLNSDSAEISIEELDLSNFVGKEIKFSHIPLVLLFTAEDGTELEIGAGYDLWRWHEAASRFGGTEEFVLKGIDEGLLFDRKILFQNESFELDKDNFRFSWYFAWGDVNDKKASVNCNSCILLTPSGKKLVSNNSTENHVYCLDNAHWPLTAVVKKNKKTGNNEHNYPCFCSRQTGNYLKSWFRSLYNKINDQDTDVYLCNADTHICFNASHMVRGKRKNLIHWDYIYLLGFWEWASKCLGYSDISFHIIFNSDSIFANLPSVRSLSTEEFQHKEI
jgi:hypothetical protein